MRAQSKKSTAVGHLFGGNKIRRRDATGTAVEPEKFLETDVTSRRRESTKRVDTIHQTVPVGNCRIFLQIHNRYRYRYMDTLRLPPGPSAARNNSIRNSLLRGIDLSSATNLAFSSKTHNPLRFSAQSLSDSTATRRHSLPMFAMTVRSECQSPNTSLCPALVPHGPPQPSPASTVARIREHCVRESTRAGQHENGVKSEDNARTLKVLCGAQHTVMSHS
jgi:hypothetical protein